MRSIMPNKALFILVWHMRYEYIQLNVIEIILALGISNSITYVYLDLAFEVHAFYNSLHVVYLISPRWYCTCVMDGFSGTLFRSYQQNHATVFISSDVNWDDYVDMLIHVIIHTYKI